MRKIVVFLETGFCGSEDQQFWKISDDLSEDDLAQMISDQAYENANRYGIEPYPTDEEVSEDDDSEYSHNIEGWYEEYDSEKHDQYATTLSGEPYWQKMY